MFRLSTPLPKPVKVLKPKKRKKASSRVLLERRADHLVREIVLDRDGYCVCPAPKKGHSDVFQCGHLISRAKKSVRYDLYNCNVQCSSDNLIHEHYPHIYTMWFIREFGQAQYERLIADSEGVRKISTEELEAIVSNLTAIQQRQRSNRTWKPYFTQKQILDGSWRNIGYDRAIPAILPDLPETHAVSPQ